MNEVEKEDEKEKWHQVETAVQTNAASATKTVAEIMKEQGEGYVEDKSILVQWVLKLGSTMFNISSALLALLKSMATVKDTIYLETGETKVVVCNPAILPTAKEFTEAFK
eukprot:13504473-Ditylum_brightwellii.AAC.1